MSNPLLTDIEAFLRTHHMAETTFGRKALGDWRFVKELRGSEKRAPRRIWPETERAIRQFMATYKAEPVKAAA